MQLTNIEEQIDQAIEQNQFIMHYQPVVHLNPDEFGKLAGLEALVRWKHPELGFLLPGSFLSVLPESAFVKLCKAIFEITLKEFFNSKFHETYPDIWVSINANAQSLINPALQEELEKILTEKEPEKIVIEITEQTAIPLIGNELKNARFQELMKELQKLKVRFAIDDLGAGYSLETLIKIVDANKIKLDRSLVSQINDHARFYQLTKHLIQMAHSLDMTVVGEGIESIIEAKVLQELDCEYGQGYYFGKPLPLSSLILEVL